MAARVRERATYEDLLRAPDDKIAELIDGELFLSPRPRIRHADLSSDLTAVLRGRFGRGGGGWHILFEPEIHLGEDSFVPDLAGWRRERVPELGDVAVIEIAPDWVCEILSPSTARLDNRTKLPKYAYCGVPHAWVIDPVLRNVEVRRLEQGRWSVIAVHAADEPFRAEPFEELEIVLDVEWPSAPAS
jgi:Uma2 family endonuclease